MKEERRLVKVVLTSNDEIAPSEADMLSIMAQELGAELRMVKRSKNRNMFRSFMRAGLAKILTFISAFTFIFGIAAIDSERIPVALLAVSGMWLILFCSANGLFD